MRSFAQPPAPSPSDRRPQVSREIGEGILFNSSATSASLSSQAVRLPSVWVVKNNWGWRKISPSTIFLLNFTPHAIFHAHMHFLSAKLNFRWKSSIDLKFSHIVNLWGYWSWPSLRSVKFNKWGVDKLTAGESPNPPYQLPHYSSLLQSQLAR